MELQQVSGPYMREEPTVLLNVRGRKFEVFVNSLEKFRAMIGGILDEARAGSRREFFLNRHPVCFGAIVDYAETGLLHCPPGVCGSQFRQELLYWGIDEGQIQKCCINDYIRAIETERKLRYLSSACSESAVQPGRCGQFRVRTVLWNLLTKPGHSRWSKVYFSISTLLLVVNIALVVLESVVSTRSLPYNDPADVPKNAQVKCQTIHDLLRYGRQLDYYFQVDLIFSIFFTIELVIRCLCVPNLRSLYTSVVIYVELFNLATFYAIYVLLTTTNVAEECPYLSSMMILIVISLRILRVVRLLAIFYHIALFKALIQTLRTSLGEILILFSFMILIVIMAGSIMTLIEMNTSHSQFENVLNGMWWALATTSTIGYGDIIPVTAFGKLFTVFVAMTGFLTIALVVPMLAANYRVVSTFLSGSSAMRVLNFMEPNMAMQPVAVVTGVKPGIPETKNEKKDFKNDVDVKA